MKKLKYTGMILMAALLVMSCDKHEIEFDARSASDVALVQIHNEIPVPSGTAYNFLKVELNGVDVTYGNKVTLSSWNTIPTALGRYYSTNTGEATIKLYQGTALNPVYEQKVTLKTGKQGVILYDYNKPPLIVEEPDNYIPDRPSYDTDTIEYVRFFNLMQEEPGVNSDLKLQYQYQYTLHPLYTLADEASGTIPAGKNVGDATGDAAKSDWINMGDPVAFGENTGWQLVPVKKTSYVTQGSARIDYRIKVTQGGVEGASMTAGDNLLICYDRSSARTVNGYTDYWTGTVGRRYYHFFSGYRKVTPGVDIVQFIEK
ncbi:MAG: hypothetical protein LBH19_02980 [Dysgonamonadaceae bacterium]|jgi:hypothetical protein|nr:hypothetical protein [Dysgonamonadaceae bacterium]